MKWYIWYRKLLKTNEKEFLEGILFILVLKTIWWLVQVCNFWYYMYKYMAMESKWMKLQAGRNSLLYYDWRRFGQ